MRDLKYFLQYIIVFTMSLVLADWLMKTKQNVEVNNVIETFKELSITTCHLKCKLHTKCISFGMKKSIMLGDVDECYLTAGDVSQYSGKPTGETLELYVTELVSIKMFVRIPLCAYLCARLCMRLHLFFSINK